MELTLVVAKDETGKVVLFEAGDSRKDEDKNRAHELTESLTEDQLAAEGLVGDVQVCYFRGQMGNAFRSRRFAVVAPVVDEEKKHKKHK